MNDLDAQLLAAHSAGDASELVKLYTYAANHIEHKDVDAACFYLTHAYVFALEIGDPAYADLQARLVGHGREPSSGGGL
jgi:hypothetical protein